MNIPRDLKPLVGAFVLVGVLLLAAAALPPAPTHAQPAPTHAQNATDVGSALEQPTSDVQWRSVAVPRRQTYEHAVMSKEDTLRHVVRAGDVLIVDLPEELDGRTVSNYVLVHAPALSWLVDYSLMWRTMPADSGRHEILIRADGPSDTLVVSIFVE